MQAALSLSGPILLIAGGRTEPTFPVGRCIARRARTLLVLGEAAKPPG